nr:MAG TPA: hypothetical protein [Caudoviricetes sp.]
MRCPILGSLLRYRGRGRGKHTPYGIARQLENTPRGIFWNCFLALVGFSGGVGCSPN